MGFLNNITDAKTAATRRLVTIPSDLFEDHGAIVRASSLMADWSRRHLT